MQSAQTSFPGWFTSSRRARWLRSAVILFTCDIQASSTSLKSSRKLGSQVVAVVAVVVARALGASPSSLLSLPACLLQALPAAYPNCSRRLLCFVNAFIHHFPLSFVLSICETPMDAQAEASPEIPLQQFMAYDFDHDSVYQVYLGSCRAVH